MPILPISSRETRAAKLGVKSAQRPPTLPRFTADEEIPCDAHKRSNRQVLVHRSDTAVERLPGRGERRFLTFNQHLSFRLVMHARQDLDQRRLAGTIVAQEAQYLTPHEVHRHVV